MRSVPVGASVAKPSMACPYAQSDVERHQYDRGGCEKGSRPTFRKTGGFSSDFSRNFREPSPNFPLITYSITMTHYPNLIIKQRGVPAAKISWMFSLLKGGSYTELFRVCSFVLRSFVRVYTHSHWLTQ